MAFYETKNSASGFRYTLHMQNHNLTFHAHLHNSFELLRVNSGRIRVRIEKKDYLLEANELILILPNLIHAYDSSECGSQTQFIIFSADYLPEIADKAITGELRHPILSPKSYEIFDDLLHHQQEHFLFRSDLYRIASFYEKNEFLPSSIQKDSDFSRWISDYLATHCTEQLDEKSVAKEIGYHPRYLSSLINRNFGVSFPSLLNEYRIRKAAKLLTHREASITEIYMESGFDSQCSFNRNFKRVMGVTPREYRKESHVKKI